MDIERTAQAIEENADQPVDGLHESLDEMKKDVFSELSTPQAASLLNVSEPYFIELLNEGKITFRNEGANRCVLAKDVITYKEQEDQARLKVLEELADQAQELGMGYE